MTTDNLEKAPLSEAVATWSGLFDLDGVSRHQSESLAYAMKVQRDDVLTAKLTQTVSFYRAVEAKAFSILPGCIGSLHEVLDIFCTLSTFDHLARAKFANVRKPIFWIRLSDEGRNVVPALPMEMAADICGIETSLLRASLIPFIKDGAVEIVRSPEGVAAIVLKTGFINDSQFRRYFRT